METACHILVSLLLLCCVWQSVPASVVPPCKFESLDEVPKSILNTTLPRGYSPKTTFLACESGCTYISRCVAIVFIPDEEDANKGKCIHHIGDWARAFYKTELGKVSEDVLIERKKCQKISAPAKGVPRGCRKIEARNYTTWVKEKGYFAAAGPNIISQSTIDQCKIQCQENKNCDLFSKLKTSQMCVFLHTTTKRFYYKSCNLRADTQICKMTQKTKGLVIALQKKQKKLGVTIEQCKAQCMKDTRCTLAECDIANGIHTCSLKAQVAVFGRTCDVLKEERCQLRKIDKPIENAVMALNIPIPKVASVNQLYQFCNQKCSRYCTQVKIAFVNKKPVCQLYTPLKALEKTCKGQECSLTVVKTLKAQLPKSSVYHQVNRRPVNTQGRNCHDICLKSHQCVGIIMKPGQMPVRKGNTIQNAVMPVCELYFRMVFKVKTCSSGKCVMSPLKNGTKVTLAFENVFRTPKDCAEMCLTLKYCTAIAYTAIIKQCSIYGRSSMVFDAVYEKKCAIAGTCTMVKVPRLSFLYSYAMLLKTTTLAKRIMTRPHMVKHDKVSACVAACQKTRQCTVVFLKTSLDKNAVRCDFLVRTPSKFGMKECHKTPRSATPRCFVRGPTNTVAFPMDSPNHSLLAIHTVTQALQCPKECEQSPTCAAVMMWPLTVPSQQSATGSAGQRSPQDRYGGQRTPHGGYRGQPGHHRAYGKRNTHGGYGGQYNPHTRHGSQSYGGQRRHHAPGQHGYGGQPNPYKAAPWRRRLLHYSGGYNAKPMQKRYGGPNDYGQQKTGDGGNNYGRTPADYGGYGQEEAPSHGRKGYGNPDTGYGGRQRRPPAFGPNSHSHQPNAYQPPQHDFFLCALVAAEPIKLPNKTGDPMETTLKTLTPHVRTRIFRKNCTDKAKNVCTMKKTEDLITKDTKDLQKYDSLGYQVAIIPRTTMLEDCRKDPQCISTVLFETRGKTNVFFGYDPILYPKNC